MLLATISFLLIATRVAWSYTPDHLGYRLRDPGTYRATNGLPRTLYVDPVPGVYGSCVMNTYLVELEPGVGQWITEWETCSTYIISTTDIGCTNELGLPCTASWGCQLGVGDGEFYMCGCNINDPLSCPNGGTCVELESDVSNWALPRDDYPHRYLEGPVLVEVSRRPSVCQCSVFFEDWTREDVTFANGDPVVLAPCSRWTASNVLVGCGVGAIASALYFPTGDYQVNPDLFTPSWPDERGQPGVGIDILPCVCAPGKFGVQCGGNLFNDQHCAYKDGETAAWPNFNPAFLCEGRGSCTWDGMEQSTKQPPPNSSDLYCYSCDEGFFGRQCQVTCGITGGSSVALAPLCPANADCVNNGTWDSPQPICVCKTGYRDPRNDGTPGQPTEDITNCLTCTNELDQDVPGCSGNGVCPLSTYSCYHLGCPGITNYVPAAPLRCNCGPGYVDLACNIPRVKNYTCGSQSIQVTCTYERVLDLADYLYTCAYSATLDTGTNPPEQYPLTGTCNSVSLIDQEYLTTDQRLRLLSGDEACAAILDQCGGQELCPVPFRRADLVSTPVSWFCDPPPARNYLKASMFARDVFCWLVGTSPDSFKCLTTPDSDFAVSCLLSVNWDQYRGRPREFAKVLLRNCGV